MKSVCAALGDDVDVRAGVAAIAGVVRRGLDLEFFNGVRIGNSDARINAEVACASAVGDVVHSHSIHLEVVLAGVISIYADILRAFAQSSGVFRGSAGARREAENFGVVAVGHGERVDLTTGDGGTERGTLGLERLDVALY